MLRQVYTSYDYSSPLRETREIQLKFKQTKLIALFTRVSQDLLKTDMESNGTGNAVSSSDIFSWVIRNPDNQAGFYTLQHSTSSSRDVTTFDVHLDTSAGAVTVPNVQLNGRQSKIITTDYHFGNLTLLYCTADILTWSKSVIVLYAEEGQTSQFAFKSPGRHLTFKSYGTANVSAASNSSAYTYTQTSGSTVLRFSDGLVVYLLETQTAWNFWAPSLSNDPHVKPDDQIFVLGPYNVRSVSIDGNTVILVGDNANTTTLEVYTGDKNVDRISWNGRILGLKKTAYGSLIATAPGAENRTISLPDLSWQVADSLPEIQRSYNDSKWTICNKTTTLSPVAPLTLPVLFSSDYGYYAGIKIYRGYFDATTATSANITVQGGLAAGFSAWLNGVWVGYHPGNASLTRVSALLDFSKATLYNTGNVLTVVTDYTGHDETSTGPAGVENPRGILGAWLYSSNTTLPFQTWKIQGSRGDIDPIRGPMNEDGLYGTRLGWHLPGYKPSSPTWTSGSLSKA